VIGSISSALAKSSPLLLTEVTQIQNAVWERSSKDRINIIHAEGVQGVRGESGMNGTQSGLDRLILQR